MEFKVYASDKTSPRSFSWLWFVRLAQMLGTIIVLGITASSASDFNTLGCSVPSKLGYNIAAAVLSFLVLIVLILSTGPTVLFRVVPWIVWGQLALDIFMLIIWIAAAGVSQYTCSDLCNACAAYDEVWATGIYCLCSTYYIYKRDQSPAPKGLASLIEERAIYSSNSWVGSSKRNSKVAFDALMVVLFAFTTAATIFWILKSRKSAAAPATTSNPADPTSQQSGGLPPAPTSGFYASEGKDTTHTQTTAQGASYPPQQTQPDMQQSGYPEPVQQYTNPTASPQGSAGEYYNQPQSQPQQTTYPPNRAEMQQSGSPEPVQQYTNPTASPQGSAGGYYNQPQSQPQQTTYPPNRVEMPSPPPQQHDVSPIAGH
ncbi:MAG: hypothetical protein Q9178_003796 [Gyalolechia marmorata]